MENKRLYPISGELFNRKVLPVIEGDYIWKRRPPKVSQYKVFSAILYILRTGCPRRDLPAEYGYGQVIYDRFNRGSGRGLWVKILANLQEDGIVFNEVIIDRTTMKVQRHGGGQKGGGRQKGTAARGYARSFMR
ncbi:MAG: transposase [Treponema sp.]|jgi:transposase|nr:transposase [Treponema sp.]